MILTICCNPCIDAYLYVDELKPKTLNRVNEVYSCIGGKGINVAKALTTLGNETFSCGFMGSEHLPLFQNELNKLNIKSKFTIFEGKTRTNYKINNSDGSITELNENGTIITKSLAEEFLILVKDLSTKANFVVLSGSLPKGLEQDYYEKVVKNITVPFGIDVEKSKMLPVLHLHPEIIKPNLEELQDLVGAKLNTESDVVCACRELIKKGAKRILASLGEQGAYLVTEEEVYFANAPKVNVASTVGAGDTMLSAAVIEITKNSPNSQILQSAIAAGSAAVMSKGTNPLDLNDYEELYSQISVRKI